MDHDTAPSPYVIAGADGPCRDQVHLQGDTITGSHTNCLTLGLVNVTGFAQFTGCSFAGG